MTASAHRFEIEHDIVDDGTVVVDVDVAAAVVVVALTVAAVVGDYSCVHPKDLNSPC